MHTKSLLHSLVILFVLSSTTIAQQLPSNYTEQPPINIPFRILKVDELVFSPNQVSIAWPDFITNSLMYMSSMYQPESILMILLGRVAAIAFSPTGDALYALCQQYNEAQKNTNYTIFKLNIDQGFIIEVSNEFLFVFNPVNPNEFTQMRVISSNSSSMQARLVIGVGNNILDITLQSYMEPKIVVYDLQKYCPTMFIMDMEHIRLSQTSDDYRLYITGDCSFVFDSKTQIMTLISTNFSTGIGMIMNEQLIFSYQRQDHGIHIYQKENQTLNEVYHLQRFFITHGYFYPEENYFAARSIDSVNNQSTIKVFQVKIDDSKTQSKYQFEAVSEIKVFMGILLKLTRKFNDIYVGNITIDYNRAVLQRWSLCVDGTYQSDGQCLNCSSKCKTCHQTADKCSICFEEDVYKDQSCGKCNDQFLGCLQCSQIVCLTCNRTANFNIQPFNYKCTCVTGSYLINQGRQCQYCKDVMIGCLNCTEANLCLQCDQKGNFVRNSTTGKCDCKQGYSLKDNNTCQFCGDQVKKCTSCIWVNEDTRCTKCIDPFNPSDDGKYCINCSLISHGCIKCIDSCTQCDSSKNYNTTVVNGSCVCQNGYGEQNDICLSCKTTGCFSCSNPNHCQKCSVDKNFNPDPVGEVCTCKNGTFQDEQKKECRYCSEKMFGCLSCETLSKCTECDASKNLELNQQQNGCVCIEKYVLINSGCDQCSELIDFCQTCAELQRTIKCQNCKTGFIYDSSTNRCKCPDGYTINKDKVCEKVKEQEKEKQSDQIDPKYFWIGGSVLLVLAGVVGYFIGKKCVKRKGHEQKFIEESVDHMEYQPASQNNESMLTESLNNSIVIE